MRTTPLTIRTEGLLLALRLVERNAEDRGKPYLDWLVLDVFVETPHFTGQFPFWTEPRELLELASRLQRMYDAFPASTSAKFEPLEGNIVLDRSIDTLGHVCIGFTLRPSVAEALKLVGTATTDQAYIPRLISEIRTFVRETESAA